MVVEKNNKVEDYKSKKGNLNFAVVGHVEWINFLKVDQLPNPESFLILKSQLNIQLVVALLSRKHFLIYL